MFRVREDTVRLWRGDCAQGGVEALTASVDGGPPPLKTEAAPRVGSPRLEAPVAGRPDWTIPRLIAEIKRVERVGIGPSQLSKALRKNVRWRRPRHTLKRRQIAAGIERVGLRLVLLEAGVARGAGRGWR